MKLGLSCGQCIRDIVLGDVDIKDVLLIITGTDFDPENDLEWENIWTTYTGSYRTVIPIDGHRSSFSIWADIVDDQDLVREIVLELHREGRLYQPRRTVKRTLTGQHRGHHWLEVVNTEHSHPAVQTAFDRFLVLDAMFGTIKQPIRDDF